jgi:TDG/mug DNA glycosylase family protein
VARTTARADELSADELREGGRILAAKVAEYRPHWLAIVGITAYRTAFGHPKAQVGPQDEEIGGARVWVLPNPSGLNAHWTPTGLAEEFSRLRKAVR